MKWEVNFLVSGLKVLEEEQIGNVTFKPPITSGGIVNSLFESCKFSKFPFNPKNFARAEILIKDEQKLNASMRGLTEIERTLDTLVFTRFCQSKCLTVGYVRNVDSDQSYPIKYSKQHISMPILGISVDTLTHRTFRSREYTRNFEHLLLKQPKDFTHSQQKVAYALRWFRLSALSRLFSESPTVPFTLDWIALETLVKINERERVKDALNRLPKILKHFPLNAVSNFHQKIVLDLPKDNEQQWQKRIDRMYLDRKYIFHEGRITMPEDFSKIYGAQEEIGDIGVLETIAGRVVSFIGKSSVKFSTLSDIWELADSYQPTESDNPPSNLGGWIQGWLP